MDIKEKAQRFVALHRGPKAFVIGNPWDAGSARILAGLGYQALATSSGASAGVLGKRDGRVTRDEALAHARAIVEAVDLPVSADLEKGFGDKPEAAAETIRLAGEVGLVGGSIEDASGDKEKPLFDFNLAVERVAAAAAEARAHPFPFILTARAENFLRGNPDLDDTIRRLQAFEQAGADVLFAPGLKDLEAIRTVVSAVSKPVNILVSSFNSDLRFEDLAAAGVKRISVGGVLARVALTAITRAARDIKEHGRFTCANDLLGMAELDSLFASTTRAN